MSETETLTVSEEFLANPVTKLVEYVNQFQNFFEARRRERDQLELEASRLPHYRTFRRTVEDTSYPNLRHVKIAIPAGMSATYMEYLSALEPAVGISEKLLSEVLTPFSRWLAEGLSDPDKLRSFSRSSGVREFTPHDTDGVALRIGECFTKGSNANITQFKNAFARNADVKEVYDRTAALNERFIRIDRKQVLTMVDRVSENLDRMAERIGEEGNEYEMSKPTVELLAKMSYTVAQEIEFYGNVAYQLTQLNVALIETADQLKKT